MADIPLILSNISTAIGLWNGLVEKRDAHKLAAVQADLTDRLIKAQAHIAELIGVVAEKTSLAADLQERLRELERHQSEHARYELVEIAAGGPFAYRLKPASALTERCSEPPHLICQRCLDIRRAKSVLVRTIDYGAETFTCRECSAVLTGDNVG